MQFNVKMVGISSRLRLSKLLECLYESPNSCINIECPCGTYFGLMGTHAQIYEKKDAKMEMKKISVR